MILARRRQAGQPHSPHCLGGLMRVLRFAFIGSLAVALSACINSTSLVIVKPDGSGTIEQTMLVNLAALKGLMAGAGAGQTKESPGVMNEAEFKRTAERMGVRPVSLTPVKQGGFEGAKAVFAFDDISKIRLDQDPQMAGPGVTASGKDDPIKFTLTRQGGTSVLTINVDEKAAASATEKVKDAPGIDQVDPAMMQMIKTIFEGFRISIDLEVDGKIIKTNADYVNGSRITLLELDAAGIFKDEAKLKELQSKIRPGASLSELRPFLKDIQGVKINHPSVTIEYR
jgi:hypothetical protein